MRRRGAVQAAARQDAELLLQPERRLGVVPARQVHGDDAHAAAELPRAAQADAGKRRDAVQKALAQRQLMAAKALDALLLHKGQRGAQTVDARQIRRAGLQPVRQIRRQQLTVRGAAGPARHKRREIGGKLVRQQQRADAARAEQTLVPRHGQRRKAERRKVDGIVSGRLRTVQQEKASVPRAGRPDGGRILHTAADVGRMRQHNKARVGPEQALERAMLQKALAVAGNAVKFHAPELLQRPHDGVVLHPADDAVVAGAQEPLDDEIQAERRARCQDDMGRRLREPEQPRKRLAQGQRLQPGLLRAAVDGAIDRRADAVEILLHAVADPGRLRERRRSVVEIDALQNRTPLFCSNPGQCGVVLVYHIGRGLSRAFGRQDHARDQPEAADQADKR